MGKNDVSSNHGQSLMAASFNIPENLSINREKILRPQIDFMQQRRVVDNDVEDKEVSIVPGREYYHCIVSHMYCVYGSKFYLVRVRAGHRAMSL